MTRRAYGSGSVLEVGPSRWRLSVSLGADPVTGKHRRITRTIEASSRQAAVHALDAFRLEVHRQQAAVPLAELLRAYLHDPDLSAADRARLRGHIDRRLDASFDVTASPPAAAILPTEPGWVVYVARSACAEVLYVGLSQNIWARMTNWRMLGGWWTDAVNVEWLYCDGEAQARQLERRLIQEHRPRHNLSQVPVLT